MTHRDNLIAGLVALALVVVLVFVVVVAGDDATPERDTVTVTAPPAVPVAVGVDGPDADVQPDTAIKLDREAREVNQNATKTPERFDLSGDLRGKDNTPVAKHTGPLATPNFPGCTTRMLSTNWSNRVSTVKGVGIHYTAGGNRPGLSDMNGLTAYANSPSAGVSWHFLIDQEGHCYYSVPIGKKAWTIGNLNSETVNIEVVGRGSEPRLFTTDASARKLGQVVRRLGRVYGFPMRLGAVRNCKVTRSGIITHWMGGGCAGGHHDIRPYDIAAVARRIAAGDTRVSGKQAGWCKRLNYWRHAGRPKGGEWERKSIRRRKLLERDRLVCTSRGARPA